MALQLALLAAGGLGAVMRRGGRERQEAEAVKADAAPMDSQSLALQLLPSRVDGHSPSEHHQPHVINLHVALQQNNAGEKEKHAPPPPPPPPPAPFSLQRLAVRSALTVVIWELVKLGVRVKLKPQPPFHSVLLSSIASSISAGRPQQRRASRWR